ncbi:hypothetical protein MWU76_14180 [Gelidibacter sp. F2691]|nr:hypothetical protein [Gelidibacter sp. F2691]
MIIKRVLSGVLITLATVFLALQTFRFEVEAAGLRVLLLILLTVLYCYQVKKRRFYFFAFLITFIIGELINFSAYFIPTFSSYHIDYLYYLANSVYILAYVFLITQMLRTMNIVEIIKKFPFHILIMLVMGAFCVVIVTNTTLSRLSYTQYAMEFVYNAIIMVLLTVALINYLHKDDKKSINLLIGSICILFSEVIQLAYFYITNINVLNVLCSLFLVLAFVFFYLQSRLDYQPQEEKSVYQDLVS